MTASTGQDRGADWAPHPSVTDAQWLPFPPSLSRAALLRVEWVLRGDRPVPRVCTWGAGGVPACRPLRPGRGHCWTGDVVSPGTASVPQAGPSSLPWRSRPGLCLGSSGEGVREQLPCASAVFQGPSRGAWVPPESKTLGVVGQEPGERPDFRHGDSGLPAAPLSTHRQSTWAGRRRRHCCWASCPPQPAVAVREPVPAKHRLP